MEKSVKAYIEKQKPTQKALLEKVRSIFMKAIPECDEKTTWGVVGFDSNRFYIVALKDKVNVGFAIKGLSKEEVALFEGRGKTMRHIEIHSLKELDEKKLVKLIKLVHKKASCSECGKG